MTYSLFAHQAAVEPLLNSGSAMLMWEMRTGKTRAVLHAFNEGLDRGGPSQLLVVTTRDGKVIFEDEAEQMGLDIPVFRLYGKERPRVEPLPDLESYPAYVPRIVTVNWEILVAWLPTLMRSQRSFILVTDEGHEHLCNPASPRFKAARDLSLKAERTWELTGTPFIKNAMDFYWQWRLLGGRANPFQYWPPERFGQRYARARYNPFRGRPLKQDGQEQRYRTGRLKRAGGYDFQGLIEGAEDELLQRMSSLSKVLESECWDIPAIRRLPRWLDEGDRFADWETSALETATQALIPVKLERALEYLRTELLERPVVCFGWSVNLTQALARALNAPLISGQTGDRERAQIRRDFQAGRVPILVGNIRSLGKSVDLSSAGHFLHVQPWWDAALQRQVEARCLGPKQTRNRIVHHYLLVKRSVDEYVWDVRLEKGEAIDRLDQAGRRIQEIA